MHLPSSYPGQNTEKSTGAHNNLLCAGFCQAITSKLLFSRVPCGREVGKTTPPDRGGWGKTEKPSTPTPGPQTGEKDGGYPQSWHGLERASRYE